MKATTIVILCLVALSAYGYDGLYGVVDGGTIHQYTPAPYKDADWVRFSNGIEFDISGPEPELPQSLTRTASEYYLVHCNGPVYPEYV